MVYRYRDGELHERGEYVKYSDYAMLEERAEFQSASMQWWASLDNDIKAIRDMLCTPTIIVQDSGSELAAAYALADHWRQQAQDKADCKVKDA